MNDETLLKMATALAGLMSELNDLILKCGVSDAGSDEGFGEQLVQLESDVWHQIGSLKSRAESLSKRIKLSKNFTG